MLAVGKTVGVKAVLSDLGPEKRKLTGALLRHLLVKSLVLPERYHLVQKNVPGGR